MTYSTTRQPLGACCNACANGGARLGLGAVQLDTTVHPGEDVYAYMRRIASEMQTEIVVAQAGKAFDAKVAAEEAAAKAAQAGFAVPPGAAAQVASEMGMPMSTKLLIGGVAAFALFMLLRRK